jgi:hypothetical protein
MESNIVEKLIRGSAEIDRMKKEIIAVANMVCGLVDAILTSSASSYDWASTGKETHISCGRVSWIIWVRPMEKPRVYGFVKYESGSCGTGVLDGIPLDKVSLVHSSLDQFVEGAIKNFPGLYSKMSPLLDVSSRI